MNHISLFQRIFYTVAPLALLFLVSCKKDKTASATPSPTAAITVDSVFTAGKIEGNVEWLRSMDAPTQPLRTGMRLVVGNIVRTDTESLLELRTASGSSFVLEEESQLQLAAWESQNGALKGRMELAMGSMLFNIQKLSVGSEVQLNTPTATAAVRGTKGGIETTGTGSLFHLEEGALQLTHKGTQTQQLLSAGEVALQTPKNFETSRAAPGKLKDKVEEKRGRMWEMRDHPVIPGLRVPANPGLQKLFERRQLRHLENIKNLKDAQSALGKQKALAQQQVRDEQQRLQKTVREAAEQKARLKNLPANTRKQATAAVRKVQKQASKAPKIDPSAVKDAKKRFGL